MKEYCWPHYYISVPKAKTLLLILFFIPSSKSILQYGHIDILNYKIPLMVIILSQNREKQKYVAPYKICVPKEYLVLVFFLSPSIKMYISIQSYRHLVLQKPSTSTYSIRCEGKLLAHYDILPKSNTLLVVLFLIT